MNTIPEHPGWLEISIDIDPVAHESLSAFFFDIGCKGIVSEDFESLNLKAYLLFQKEFEDIRSRIELFLEKLRDIFPQIKSWKLKITRIENQDWSISWRRFFYPDQVTQNLMIIPAWEDVPPTLTCEVVRIDPGPAFGTGQHPTTRMCLQAMEKVRLADSWSMLDVGTGSGILAIYGVKLGAGKVAAIDIDPEAVRWAERNIRLNDLPLKIELSSESLEHWYEPFSLITANLVLGTILDLAPHFQRLLDAEGRLILSGILREQVNVAEEKLNECNLFKDDIIYQEEWTCLIMRCGEKVGRERQNSNRVKKCEDFLLKR